MVKNTLLVGLRFSVRLNSSLLTANGNGGFQQKRHMVRTEDLVLPSNYPDPWPYKERGYLYHYHGWFDRTKPRFHQNTKLITIEGNVGAGKGKVGRKIAEIFGLKYMRAFKMDDIMIDRYGNDMRKFYHLFPKRYRIPDLNMFFRNPYDDMSAVMQDMIYYCRWEQYLNALAHMFNTGQGVVLERPVHSDFIFANAMRAKNYIGSEFFKRYYYLRKMSMDPLKYWPHIVIYLDAPVSRCLENIKMRGNKNETVAIDEKYLKTIEESYKDVLNEQKRHSKIFVYDWSNPTDEDIDRIVEDIEALDMDFYQWMSGDVWEEWFNIGTEFHYTVARQRVTEKIDIKIDAWDHDLADHECAEMNVYPFDYYHYENVMIHEVLKSRYSYGYQRKKDGMKGMGFNRIYLGVPEKWIEYEYQEHAYGMNYSLKNYADPVGKEYDPDYLHAH